MTAQIYNDSQQISIEDWGETDSTERSLGAFKKEIANS